MGAHASSGGAVDSAPITLTITAAEIAARWLADTGAYIEWTEITTTMRVTSFVERSNTLDENVAVSGRSLAYLSGASTFDVDANGGNFAARAVPTVATYAAFDDLPPVQVVDDAAFGPTVYRLLDGCSAYVLLQGDAAPTTGEVVFELYVS